MLKDDGCNTNVISRDSFKKLGQMLNIQNVAFVISHSNKNENETSNEMVLDAKIELGQYQYRWNWIVANCRYDVLLGMPWR